MTAKQIISKFLPAIGSFCIIQRLPQQLKPEPPQSQSAPSSTKANKRLHHKQK